MITAKIDRRRQNNCPPTGRFRKTSEEIVAGHDGRAMSDCPQEFFEIFSAQWLAMLLIAKHDGVVEVKNDAAIGPLEETKLDFVEADCLEKNDDIMPARFFENAQPFRHAGTPSRNNRRLHPESGIVIKAIPQPQPGAGSVAMFNDTKYFHAIGGEESLSYNFLARHSSG
jgi:hypothetical protein